MVVDMFLFIVDNNGNIVNARYCESAIGVLRLGEYIIVILSIPGRPYKFSSPKEGNEPIGKSICYARNIIHKITKMIYKESD